MTFIKRKEVLDRFRPKDIFFEAQDIIESVPGETGLQKVIKCKDCKYQIPYAHDPNMFHCEKTKLYNRSIEDGDGEFWCAFAEPKEELQKSGIGDYILVEDFIKFFDEKMSEAPLPKETIESIRQTWLSNVPITRAKKVVYSEWEEEHDGNGWNDWYNYRCKNCGTKFDKFEHTKYCPECGAVMFKEEKK